MSVAAARLNRILADALHDAGVPVFSVIPSSSVQCADGVLHYMAIHPVRAALQHGLLPLVMGDVALDSVRGATIVSTEEVFAYLVNAFAGDPALTVTRLLLAGETDGVYAGTPGPGAPVIERITPGNWEEVRAGVGGSRGADVTGGMAAKVQDMLRLVSAHPPLTACIFSGLVDGNLARAMAGERIGTEISAECSVLSAECSER